MKEECSQTEYFLEIGEFRARGLCLSVVTPGNQSGTYLCSRNLEGPSCERIIVSSPEAQFTDGVEARC